MKILKFLKSKNKKEILYNKLYKEIDNLEDFEKIVKCPIRSRIFLRNIDPKIRKDFIDVLKNVSDTFELDEKVLIDKVRKKGKIEYDDNYRLLGGLNPNHLKINRKKHKKIVKDEKLVKPTIKASLVHETIHFACDHLNIDGDINGFNECTTQILTEKIMKENYPDEEYKNIALYDLYKDILLDLTTDEKLIDMCKNLNYKSLKKEFAKESTYYFINEVFSKELNHQSNSFDGSRENIKNIKERLLDAVMKEEICRINVEASQMIGIDESVHSKVEKIKEDITKHFEKVKDRYKDEKFGYFEHHFYGEHEKEELITKVERAIDSQRVSRQLRGLKSFGAYISDIKQDDQKMMLKLEELEGECKKYILEDVDKKDLSKKQEIYIKNNGKLYPASLDAYERLEKLKNVEELKAELEQNAISHTSILENDETHDLATEVLLNKTDLYGGNIPEREFTAKRLGEPQEITT